MSLLQLADDVGYVTWACGMRMCMCTCHTRMSFIEQRGHTVLFIVSIAAGARQIWGMELVHAFCVVDLAVLLHVLQLPVENEVLRLVMTCCGFLQSIGNGETRVCFFLVCVLVLLVI